ncbi:hypothetical protein O6H91_16G055600 [Diphasiastrum complanatum]|uniref:Uncharacterized protein n=1 Tax=Diphasiastrum complanatum TaxID=34168 RepID=A0ACC2BDE9_DIPCM|nr:hypothetical protein O6H91_Y048600 [Diphasiastrum complanatum]KAJ7527462.1 hypothetical protein O6H91_16G055600 [Diphasiastrum complanatum]
MASSTTIYPDGTTISNRSQAQIYDQEPSALHQIGESAEPTTSFQRNSTASFDCNICLDAANDPIVTLCGHLFCWPCLYRWLQHSACKDCPVCKAAVQEEKVIPLYGRGNLQPVDPRTKSFPDIPSRPVGQRSETEHSDQRYSLPGFFDYGAGLHSSATTARLGNITLSARLGFYPLLSSRSIRFSDSGNLASGRYVATFGGHGRISDLAHQQQEEVFMSKLAFLLVFGILCLLFL